MMKAPLVRFESFLLIKVSYMIHSFVRHSILVQARHSANYPAAQKPLADKHMMGNTDIYGGRRFSTPTRGSVVSRLGLQRPLPRRLRIVGRGRLCGAEADTSETNRQSLVQSVEGALG